MLLDAFRAGGWGMYPTALFGTISLALMIDAVRRPQRPTGALPSMIVATALAGLLGFFAGIIATFGTASGFPVDDQFRIMMIGVAESLSNITLALVFGVFLALLSAARGWRRRATFSDG